MARYINNQILTQTLRASRVCIFNVPGANTWIVPDNVTCATFELWGSGGGGGARCCCECYHQGSGGGAGTFMAATIPVTPGTTYTLYVGCASDSIEAGGTGCHLCCLATAGQATYITGTGITTLCAGGGNSGNNDCYMHCMCSPCCQGCTTMNQCAALSSNYPTTSSICAKPYINICDGGGSTKANYGHVGLYTDASAYYYSSSTGSLPFRSAMLTTTNWCTSGYRSRVEQPGWFGHGGVGQFSNECCCCGPAGTGRSGLILIRY